MRVTGQGCCEVEVPTVSKQVALLGVNSSCRPAAGPLPNTRVIPRRRVAPAAPENVAHRTKWYFLPPIPTFRLKAKGADGISRSWLKQSRRMGCSSKTIYCPTHFHCFIAPRSKYAELLVSTLDGIKSLNCDKGLPTSVILYRMCFTKCMKSCLFLPRNSDIVLSEKHLSSSPTPSSRVYSPPLRNNSRL